MRSTPTRLIGLALAIPALLIGGLAYTTAHTQGRARIGVEQEFARRAALAASLTASALGGTTDQWTKSFRGPRAEVAAALHAAHAYDPGTTAVLDARGTPIATIPARGWRPDPGAAPAIADALSGRVGLSDLSAAGGGRLTLAVPIAAADGHRVVVEVVPASLLAGFASAYLATAPAIRGGDGYLVDSRGVVLASSNRIVPGSPLPARALSAAIRTRSAGDYSSRHFASAPLVGTRLRVVLTAPRSALLAPVSASKRTAWLLFAAFVTALAALIAVGLSAMRKSSQLVGAHEREQAAQQLARERLHDTLTGLPNRALFLDRVGQALALAGRGDRAMAVLYIELYRFKRNNDSLGHACGDELLVTLAGRLDSALRPGDTVSRFGGDEFLVLCNDLEGADDALAIAERVTRALDQPFVLDARSVHVSCCIGIAVQPAGAPAVDPAMLVRDADAAMYSAKAQGPGSLRVFDADLRGEALMRLDTEVALREAISAGDLRVHYQPIVSLPDGELRGVEALVRWERPGVGLVPPMAFIGLAEECGLIGELGAWVLRTAMADVDAWNADGLIGPDFVLSVNVSAVQLADDSLPRTIADSLATWSLAPCELWLEITETAVASDPEGARDQILALSALGVRVALDDFGVGQSSLEQLSQQLPVDVLKLDRSFTAHLEDERQRAVVAAIAPMADALHMTAIAEGVETVAQAEELSALGYPLAQGFFFSRPLGSTAMYVELADIAARATRARAA
jgi:diguanylate cyclase (GGDEF)-like protein